MWIDPFVEELHEIRKSHAREFNFDMDALFHDWLEKQQSCGRDYISFPIQAKKVAEDSKKYALPKNRKDK